MAGMRVNVSYFQNYLFFAEQIEYLASCYWITRQGIQPIHHKVEMTVIFDIKAPKTTKQQKKYQ
jgi:hypothetical protein